MASQFKVGDRVVYRGPRSSCLISGKTYLIFEDSRHGLGVDCVGSDERLTHAVNFEDSQEWELAALPTPFESLVLDYIRSELKDG
jgi:hypothetical protein